MSDEELLIAVANTGHGPSDELAGPASVDRWWRSIGGGDGGRVGTEGPALLRCARAVIRARALRNNGIVVDVDAATLERLALRPDLGGEWPALRAAAAGDLGREIGAATVAALLRASARPGWPRFKACRGEDCRFVFVDASRNASRRWCDMAACGNRAKSATFRERHRPAT
jgi:predicted RNA-binding Zn ribbon-like protein